MMANRLRVVLDKCIDKAQSTFVPGKLIIDNILVTYEVLNNLVNKRNGRKGCMALKLDMRVEWDFCRE